MTTANPFYRSSTPPVMQGVWLFLALLTSVVFGWFIAGAGLTAAGALMVMPFVVGYLVLVFLRPKIGLLSALVYCFVMPTLGKHIAGPQFGLGVDALLVLTWLGVIFYRGNRYRFRHLHNDLVWLALVWFLLTVLQLGNPNRPDPVGWLQEMRSQTLYWILIVPLTMLVFKKRSDMDLFLNIIILLSAIGALYGMKQLYIGVDSAEYAWLEAGAKKTHLLFGKLRVFSYYSEAAQFGASQAQLAVMCFILFTGPHTTGKRIWYLICGLLIFYGMLISGTRGAMGGLVGGGFLFLVLSKQTKILILGMIIGGGFIGMLKFTMIGQNNDQIRRMRTSLDPNDASLQVRLINQRILKDILASQPFGTGVGTIGQWGTTYNKHLAISRIPPDSLFVKVWAMYGVIGFILWMGIMLYIVGKGAGMIWRTRDPLLKNQLTALCAGAFGILVCSYGNEVQNAMPSAIIVYMSWAFIWMGSRWDTPVKSVQP